MPSSSQSDLSKQANVQKNIKFIEWREEMLKMVLELAGALQDRNLDI